LNEKTIHDVTLPLFPGMTVFPGDPAFMLEKTGSLDRGDGFNLSKITLGSHCGTHVDAPNHFFPEGLTVENLPLETFIGAAKVVEIGARDRIRPEDLQRADIQAGDRILLKTVNSRLFQENNFRQDYVHLSPDSAWYLRNKKIRLIGIDYFSIDGLGEDEGPCHRILLGAGIIIMEGLNLVDIKEGRYDLIALPLRLAGCDGSPVRAVLIEK
jgi:arylformamidase